MIVGIVLGSMLLGTPLRSPSPVASLAFNQEQFPGKPAEAKDDKPVAPPTTWFDKEEDTFDEPTDPKREGDLKHDREEGKKFAVEVLKEEKPSKNLEYQTRVERIGQELAHIANHTTLSALWGDKRHSVFHYRFVVLQGDDINAFSLPGGYIFLYEGLMKFVESDDELAGVIGHEISHAAFRHVATMEHEQSKAQLYQIPLILAAILAHSPGGVLSTEALVQSTQSGWSIKAEKAADFGGFQILTHSHYNPVAMLTFMERLQKQSRVIDNFINNTIFQDHPITRERAEAMEDDLRNAGIPVERSKASPTYRIILKDLPGGNVEADFDGRKIYTFAGTDAKERAESAEQGLDRFYDAVPIMYEVAADYEDNAVTWKGQPILSISQEDADAAHTTQSKLLRSTVQSIKNSLFLLGYRVWTGS